MKINLITGAVNDKADAFVEVTFEDFWKTYLTLLSARKGVESFTSKEVDLLVFLLTNDVNVSYFEGSLRKNLCEKLNINTTELNHILKDLTRRGIIVPPKDGKRRGQWYLTDSLKLFHRFVNSKKSVNFVFPLTIIDG